ncbi:ABC-F family ATP-binding cassette domain-containing protein [Francisella adeliensis]|uniref:Probable ATP-binding protein YheS n=1 Tax=Francisella adeliensis TaxID=2007306 RepID=A0A2Z4XYY5_9GAMM|nr:ATP-binding cassette domain-containing protein [Francisella adeliensis]AXA33858.1 ABC transporter ATP-binding protein [Francisella adeliensis]MBK2085760.1 ATP-binding cassette domain-containing protein [Francisella adeliensis]MBK2097638.1 ATP-binding cassette domain-containing protein [Francisella adeliensis]QIW12095.1 ATP-binding cassette domain-containing protein [Francisella adeliensis]QIW13969.1 ATP-binding cassette domain-containing protein [Francisella adeliensis]
MIFFKNISYQVDVKELFNDINFSIFQNQKIGLVGKNGTGKTTLFNLIQRNIVPDKGDLEIAKNTRIVTVKQDVDNFDVKVIDYVANGVAFVKDLRQKMSNALATENFVDYSHYHEEYESLGGYSIEAQAGKLLSGLGFNTAQLDQQVKELSGGWQIRLNLAQALLQESDILLLDEPTNHLDLDAVLWLEQYLQEYKGSLLLISHDRIFLDNVVKQIFHIDERQVVSYTGDYSSFEKQSYEQKILQQKSFDKQQKHIDHLESFINRFKAKASKAKQAQSRMKMLDKIQRVESVKSESDFSFEFKETKELGGTLVSLQNADLGYGDKTILQKIGLGIYNDMRIGLLGLNGAGKSTLIKSLIGEIDILSGEMEKHPNLKVGYFSQHSLDVLDMDASPLLQMQRLDPKATQQKLRTFLGSFNFVGDKALAKTGTFSGGEKARLALAMIVYQEPNFLLLDEPTNHLDIGVREALTVALQSFMGAIILVSHDRFLLESTVDEYMLVGEGAVKPFDGDMKDYYKYILEVKKNENSPKKAVVTEKKEKTKLTSNQRRQQKPIQDKIKKLERTIDKLQKQNSEMEKILEDQELYNDKIKLQEILDKHAQIKTQLEETEAEWLENLEKLEQLNN